MIEETLQEEQLAIAVRKDAKELLKRVNAALKTIEKNGSLKALREKYLSPKQTPGEDASRTAGDKS